MKPDGYKFESLGWVRDGSESTATKNFYKKGDQTMNNNNYDAFRTFIEGRFDFGGGGRA